MPKTLPTTNIDAKFTAGPAINKTKAAPGDKPFSIRATAIGIEPVAHKYIGKAKSNTNSILSRELSANKAKNSFGTATVIIPATTRPIIRYLPISCIIST